MTTGHSSNLTLTGQLPFILLVSAALAFVLSLVLLRFYKRSVLRSMSRRAEAAASLQPPPAESEFPALPHETTPRTPPAACAADYFARASRAPWRLAAVYAIAGLAYALFIAAAELAGSSISFSRHRVLFLFWCFAWPVVLAITLIACTSWRSKAAVVLPYFLVLTSGLLIGLSPFQIITIWALANGAATLLLLAFLLRRIRAVGPLVFTFTLLAVAGSQIAVNFIALDLEHGQRITGAAFSLGFGARGFFLFLLVIGMIAFASVGWFALRWLGRRYEGKKITDQSLTLDAIWLIFAIVHSIFLALNGPVWALGGLLAFLGYKIVLALGLRLVRVHPTTGPRLLLLRVFSLGRRSERMFDAIGRHWRHVGSIQLIAGPDLATSTVEPHEFLDFIGGKLARRFIDGPLAFQRRRAEMDLKRDFDGRFRVTDFFCQDDTWQMVLRRLVGESDAVLMDLRGFSRTNGGCVFEIQELMKAANPARLLFVTDKTTDEAFLHETITRATKMAWFSHILRGERASFSSLAALAAGAKSAS